MQDLPTVDAAGTIRCGKCEKVLPTWRATHQHLFTCLKWGYKAQPQYIRDLVSKERRDARAQAKVEVEPPTETTWKTEPEEVPADAAYGGDMWQSSWYWRWSSDVWHQGAHDREDEVWHEACGWQDVAARSSTQPRRVSFTVLDQEQGLYTDGSTLYRMIAVPWSTWKDQARGSEPDHSPSRSCVPRLAEADPLQIQEISRQSAVKDQINVLKTLQRFRVKEAYVKCSAPPSLEDGKRAVWPMKLHGYSLQFEAFKKHLSNDKNVQTGQVTCVHMRTCGFAFAFFDTHALVRTLQHAHACH